MSKFQEILDSEYCCESNEISEFLFETYNLDIELVSEGFVDKAKSVLNKIWEAFLKFLKKVREFFVNMYEKVRKFFVKDKVIEVEDVIPVEKWESIARDIVNASVHGIEDFVKNHHTIKQIENKNLQSEDIIKALKSARWFNRPSTGSIIHKGSVPYIIHVNKLPKARMDVNEKFYKHVDGLVKELTRYGRQFDVIRESAPAIIAWCESVFIDLPKDHPDYKEQLGYFTSSVQQIIIKEHVGACIKGMTELTNDAKKVLKAISEAK